MPSITDMPLIAAMRNKLGYYSFRQKVLANNVANASTPGFRPLEVKEPKYEALGAVPPSIAALPPALTSQMHIEGHQIDDDPAFATNKGEDFETTPNGNAVSLEDEMMKVTSNQMDYQTVASLYEQSLGLIKLAVGKGS